MQWNPLVPELSVSDLTASVQFYTELIGFDIAFRRAAPDFVYLDLGGAQLMLEQDHDGGWVTAEASHPRGRGLNLQIEVQDVRQLRERLLNAGMTLFRDVHESWYDVDGGGQEGQLELLVQDPDGYLIRLVQVLDAPEGA